MSWLKKDLSGLVVLLSLPLLVLACLASRSFRSRKQPRLMWGPTPIISNKYWSEAMRQAGYVSQTCMFRFFPAVNKASDFDWYVGQWFGWVPRPLRHAATMIVGGVAGFIRAVFKFDVQHFTFSGGFLGPTALWFLEAPLLKLAGVKTVVMPYGGDFFMYSRIVDPCTRYGMNISYPETPDVKRNWKPGIFTGAVMRMR